ncbi:MAG: DNA cytosine methyltransferase [Pseudomonadota bacterium]
MLRQLIRDGLIAAGDVDERSITEVKADDLKNYTQCHFFSGIGGWSVALRLAMWEDDRPVWTGSCPCQPFSSAGKQKGKNDERHLWPVWFRLISECRPAIVFGEQVAAAITHGWWDDVANDLENEGYSCGAAVLPACSVGKPHKRDRLWFVGNARQQPSGNESVGFGGEWQHSVTAEFGSETRHRFADTSSMGNAELYGCDGGSQRRSVGTGENEGRVLQSERPSASELMAGTERLGQQGQGAMGKSQYSTPCGYGQTNQSVDDCTGEYEWLICPDGKTRPVKRGVSLLAHGIQHRTPILHAFGNAIVPQVAAEFIKAVSKDFMLNKVYLETA